MDEYYTKKEIANQCKQEMFDFLKLHTDIENKTFLEPSAGAGVFLDNEHNWTAVDIEPKNDSVQKMDYLSNSFEADFAIGNPPFGKRSKLAIDFLNKALAETKCVGFIVPVQFKKWSVQSKITSTAKLISTTDLPLNSFTFYDKDYELRCCFQIWSTEYGVDTRIKTKPPTEHEDFITYQYNRTVQAERYFDYDWDFAVLRQGYGDFNKLYYNESDLDRKKQWIFIKANSDDALRKLKNIDYEKLSQRNTQIPGFGKADLVDEYIKQN